MQTLEELNAHYKAVRARLNGSLPPKLVFIAPPEPEPEPQPEPVVQAILSEPIPMPLTSTQQILKEVAEKHGITIQDLKGPCRRLKYALPRHEAAYRIVKELGFSLPKTGRVLGKRDHTTILNSVRKYEKKLSAS
jgi:chromosomal replication initiation ATPase DnaA